MPYFLKWCGLVYFSVTGFEIISCFPLSDSTSYLPFLGSICNCSFETHPLEPMASLINPTHPVSSPQRRRCQAEFLHPFQSHLSDPGGTGLSQACMTHLLG